MPRPDARLVIVNLQDPAPPEAAAAAGPHVGIWWASDATIAALVHSVAEAEAGAGFLDSPLQHRTTWSEVARAFGRRPNDDYFCVPRGRVLVRQKTRSGVVYHGNAAGAETLARLAALYGLGEWQAMTDEHYLFGAAADELFEDWD